jgi:ubiquinone/menaquinone biosynthesis C-methylase UbiE
MTVQYDPAAWERGHAAFGGPIDWTLPERDYTLKLIESAASVLEVGSNHGQLIGALRSRGWAGAYVGVDITPAFLKVAKAAYPHEVFVLGDVRRLSQSDASVNTVVCLNVFQHLDDIRRPLEELCRVAEHAVVVALWTATKQRTHCRDGFINRYILKQHLSAVMPDGWCEVQSMSRGDDTVIEFRREE